MKINVTEIKNNLYNLKHLKKYQFKNKFRINIYLILLNLRTYLKRIC